MGNKLTFEPPIGTPLGDCYQHVSKLVTKNKILKIALENLLTMEEYKQTRGEESKMHSKVVLQAKIILKTI